MDELNRTIIMDSPDPGNHIRSWDIDTLKMRLDLCINDEERIEVLDCYRKEYPGNLEVLKMRLALCKNEADKIEVLDRYCKVRPWDIKVWEMRLDLCKNEADKIEVLERCLKVRPWDLEVWGMRLALCKNEADKIEVLERCLKVRSWDLKVWEMRVNLCSNKDDLKNVLERFVKTGCDNWKNCFQLIRDCKLNDEQKIEVIVEQKIYETFENLNDSSDADYENIRNEVLNLFVIDQDIEKLKENAQINSGSFIDSYKLAEAYRAANDTANEMLVWLRFIEKNQNKPIGYLGFSSVGEPSDLLDAVAHYYSNNRWDRSMNEVFNNLIENINIDRHIDSLPDTLKGCIYRQAWCFIDCDYEFSAEKWEKYLENDSNNYYALRNCGECFANIGDATKANEMYTRAFEATPDRDEKNKIIEEQKNLIGNLRENTEESLKLNQAIERELAELNKPQETQQEVNNEPELLNAAELQVNVGQNKGAPKSQQVNADNQVQKEKNRTVGKK